MKLFRETFLGGCTILVLCLHAYAEAPDPKSPPFIPPLAKAVLAPALKAAAERDQVDLSQATGVGETPAVGDSAVFWIGATSGKSTKQWLVRLTRGAASPKELKDHRGKKITKYLSWGEIVAFESDVDALDLWIAGPVDTSESAINKRDAVSPARVSRARVFVPKDFLRLGLDDTERVSSHISKRAQELSKEDPKFKPAHLYVLGEPIKPENIAQAKPIAERIGLTPAMARAWVGGFVALESFYELATDVPALNEIAEIVCQKPSVWKLTKLVSGTRFRTTFGGKNRAPVDSGKIGFLPVSQESFDAPFAFFFGKDPIVAGAMLVTRPKPPMDVSAGILVIIAGHPVDKTRVVELMAISSTRGTVTSSGKTAASTYPLR